MRVGRRSRVLGLDGPPGDAVSYAKAAHCPPGRQIFFRRPSAYSATDRGWPPTVVGRREVLKLATIAFGDCGLRLLGVLEFATIAVFGLIVAIYRPLGVGTCHDRRVRPDRGDLSTARCRNLPRSPWSG